jgi:creatinine amidohydrolase
MKCGELQACIIPTGATEQHLEHLAMDHDWRSVMHIATLVAQRLAPHVIVAPGLSVGISEHHMKHAGTMSAMPGGWLSVLGDEIRSMNDAGFSNILVLNGHGGNAAPCRSVWGQFQQRFNINLQFASYWEFLPEEEANRLLKTGCCPGHAQEFETAIALAAFPENVRMKAMHDQEDQTPLLATADAGQAMIDIIVDRISSHLAAMINGTNIAEVPPFWP